MKETWSGKLLRVFVGGADRSGAQPLYTAIVERARSEGLSGVTVLKGVEGFGSHSVVHAARVFDLSTDLPIVIEVIDSEEKIQSFAAIVGDMMVDGVMTIADVQVIRYKSGAPKA